MPYRKRSASTRSYGYSRYARKPMYKKPMYTHRKRTLTVKPDGIIKEKVNVIKEWISTAQIGGTDEQQRVNILWGSTSGGPG